MYVYCLCTVYNVNKKLYRKSTKKMFFRMENLYNPILYIIWNINDDIPVSQHKCLMNYECLYIMNQHCRQETSTKIVLLPFIVKVVIYQNVSHQIQIFSTFICICMVYIIYVIRPKLDLVTHL